MEFIPLDGVQRELFQELYNVREKYPDLTVYVRLKVLNREFPMRTDEVKNILFELLEQKLFTSRGIGWNGFPLFLRLSESGEKYILDEEAYLNGSKE